MNIKIFINLLDPNGKVPLALRAKGGKRRRKAIKRGTNRTVRHGWVRELTPLKVRWNFGKAEPAW